MTQAPATIKDTHRVTIYGNEYWIAVGSEILIDNWYTSERLQISNWDEAEFYVQSSNTDAWSALNVRITGRTLQRRQGRLWIRVAIEFVQDGDENIQHAGWLAI